MEQKGWFYQICFRHSNGFSESGETPKKCQEHRSIQRGQKCCLGFPLLVRQTGLYHCLKFLVVCKEGGNIQYVILSVPAHLHTGSPLVGVHPPHPMISAMAAANPALLYAWSLLFWSGCHLNQVDQQNHVSMPGQRQPLLTNERTKDTIEFELSSTPLTQEKSRVPGMKPWEAMCTGRIKYEFKKPLCISDYIEIPWGRKVHLLHCK